MHKYQQFIGFCDDCNKTYEKCECGVYMSAHRHGRTRPLPGHSDANKTIAIGLRTPAKGKRAPA